MSQNRTPVIPALASKILTYLANVEGDIANICAKDFGLTCAVFEAEIHRMILAGLIVEPAKSPCTVDMDITARFIGVLNSDDQTIQIAITDIGKEWLEKHQPKP